MEEDLLSMFNQQRIQVYQFLISYPILYSTNALDLHLHSFIFVVCKLKGFVFTQHSLNKPAKTFI